MKKSRTPENIIKEAANFFNVDVPYLLKDERTRTRVQMRQMVYKALRQHCMISFQQIGRLFKKDHTTIIHGISKLNNLMDVYPELSLEYEELINHLKKQINDLHFNSSCCPYCGRYNLVDRDGGEGRRIKRSAHEERPA
jgi:chromosomal replication initiator protein